MGADACGRVIDWVVSARTSECWGEGRHCIGPFQGLRHRRRGRVDGFRGRNNGGLELLERGFE